MKKTSQHYLDSFDGEGTSDNPYMLYRIRDLDQLQAYIRDWTVEHDEKTHFALGNDISGYTFRNIPTFTGVFDGNGHTIEVVKRTTDPSFEGMGLFHTVDRGSSILNLSIDYVNIVGQHRLGAIAGSSGGTIRNCHVQGGIIYGLSAIGGLVGVNTGIITDCTVMHDVEGQADVGGIVGLNNGGYITRCSSSGFIFGDQCVGRICGTNAGVIEDVWACGEIHGNRFVGTLVGRNEGKLIGSSKHNVTWAEINKSLGPFQDRLERMGLHL